MRAHRHVVTKLQRLCVLSVATLAVACDNESAPDQQAQAPAPATFVGSAACAGCHMAEAELWRGSHHDDALQVAGTDTVLGDFDNAEFAYNGITTRFFRRDGEPWVRTDGPDGSLEEYRITHAIGIEPLQQYLIEFPGGRHQVLSIAWDTRPAAAGGQRWFHLYPGDDISADDPLHWTGTFQSWNTMCAECHSTDLVKAYMPEDDRFETAWAEIDVGCEACHGPGSLHAADPAIAPIALPAIERAWVFSDDTAIASLAAASGRSNELEVCAQCHSRRAQLSDEFAPGMPFLDSFRPAYLDPGLYHADGQISDEVYVYGSFLQSAMAEAGVTCSDCHEPHSTRLRADGNAVCAQCHESSTFDVPAHHFHEPAAAAPQCVDCHMRAETYMVVDPRRDHSFRVPRPDLSSRIDSPNACNDCHDDRDADWAAARVAEWYPNGRRTEFHYGEALHAGRHWAIDARTLLRRVIEDTAQPAIVRGTAVSLLAAQLSDADVTLIRDALNDESHLVQLAAIEVARALPTRLRVEYAQRFLTSPLLSLRVAAARSLLEARSELGARRQQDLDAAIAEYEEAQRFNSDRGEGLSNRATLAADLGRLDEAETLLNLSIERQPAFSAAYANLADLHRRAGREQEAEQVLRLGLGVNPDDPGLRLALGLSLVRSGRSGDAVAELAAAAEYGPDDPYYSYVYGIALNSTGDSSAAIDRLRRTSERFPGHRNTLFGLATILRDAGGIEEALEYARRLADLVPADQSVQNLLAELESAAQR